MSRQSIWNERVKGRMRAALMAFAMHAMVGHGAPIPSELAVRSPPTETLLPDGRTLYVGTSSESATARVTITTPNASPRALAAPASLARTHHTATVLPNGRVLIWGGLDAKGAMVDEGAWFFPRTDSFETSTTIALLPRAGHTATVLTDGRLLVTGGWNPQFGPLTEAELWDYRTNASELLSTDLVPPRIGHSATLLADGRVLILGGYDANGNRFTDAALYDPNRVAFVSLPASSASRTDGATKGPTLAASIPQPDVTDFPPNGLLALRFSEPIDVTTLTEASVTVSGPEGTVAAHVVAAESGRLAFVQPHRDLTPASRYTLIIDGARASSGAPFGFTTIAFSTARASSPLDGTSGTSRNDALPSASAATDPGGAPAGDAHVPNSIARVAADKDDPSAGNVLRLMTGAATTDLRPGCPASAPMVTFCRPLATWDGGFWLPGQNSIDGHWRINGTMPAKPDAHLLDGRALSHGATGVYGKVLRIDDQPEAGATVTIGTATVQTDAQGVFVLVNAPVGHQTLMIDGSTADSAGVEYGDFFVGVDVTAGQMTAFPDNLYLPRIHPQDKVTLPSPTTEETVITHPEMPGLEIHIPPNTIVRDRNGGVLTQLAIVPMPVDRAPIPMMVNSPMFFVFEPSGATLQASTISTATPGVTIIYPNMTGAPPGATAQLGIYDSIQGWHLYGQGHVTSDGKSIAPDIGPPLPELPTMNTGIGGKPAPPTAPPPCDASGPCPCSPPTTYGTSGPNSGPSPPSSGPSGGGHGPPCDESEPVDLSTGLFLHAGTDLAINDILPISITRVYRTNDSVARDFGIGVSDNYGLYLYNPTGAGTDYTNFGLVLPDGAQVPFTLVSGSLDNNDARWQPSGPAGAWQGSNVQLRSSDLTPQRAFVVSRKDGLQYIFDALYNIPNDQNVLLGIRDRFGNTIRFGSTAGLITSVTSPSGRKITLTRSPTDQSNRIDQLTDSTGRLVQYTYVSTGNGVGSLQQVQYADSTTEQFSYWPGGQLHTITDPRGHVVVTNGMPDANGRIHQQTLADQTSTFVFDYIVDGSGHVTQTTVTDPNQHQRVVTFDSKGYVLTDTRGYGTAIAQTRTYLRGANELITDETDALSRTTHYEYDANANIISVTLLYQSLHPIPYHFTYTADFNQIASFTDPLNHTTNFGYTNGCLTSIKDALQHTTSRVCNGAGEVVSVTDVLVGHTTQYGYSGYDLHTVTDALNRTTTYEVDALGRIISTQDAAGDLAQWTYDLRDRISTSIDPLGQITQYIYDNDNNLMSVTDPKGNYIQFGYDNFNRKTGHTDALNNPESWSYDALGNLLIHTDRKGQHIRFNIVPYDALNRLQQVNYDDGSTTALMWDAGNRVHQFTDSISGTIVRTFDDLDRLMSEQTPQGTGSTTIGYVYDDASRRETMTLTPASQSQIAYMFDDANRLHQIQQGSETVTIDYYDNNQRKTLTLPNSMTVNYAFDNADQLTGLTYKKSDSSVVGTLIYGYDAAGRRISQTGTWASDQLPTATTADSVFNADNQQTSFNGATLAYDLNGNLTSDGTYTYQLDVRDQLAAVKQGQTSIGTFTYDAVGRRTSKAIQGQLGTISYLYDGLNAVQEVQGATTRPILTGLAIDERFARSEVAGRRYFLVDGLGSTVALMDSNQGSQQTYRYEPYGEATSAGSSDNTYQYTGRENDGTGLYYYRTRYYSVNFKRFLSEDPAGLVGGFNLYQYVRDEPPLLVDPLGLYGAGIYAGGSAEAGVYGGLGWQGGSGIGIFGGGATGFNAGGFTQSGGFWGAGHLNAWSVGASIGLNWGGFLTNANCAKQLLGPFDTYTFNTPVGYAQFAISDGTWVLGFGPGRSAGVSVSEYPVNTSLASGCGCP